MSKYIAVNDIPGHCYLEGLGTSGFNSGYNALQIENRHSFGLNEALTKTIGLHTISVGGNIWKQFAQENADYPAAPISGFSNYTGFGLADFLLGYLNNFTQGGGEVYRAAQECERAFAAGDKWENHRGHRPQRHDARVAGRQL